MDSATVTLGSGHKMPKMGFGTWNITGNQAEAAVSAAIEAGYRHFDCAPAYYNEDSVGNALQAAVSSGKVSRSELFITSKLWNTCHEPQHVLPALQRTLSMLKLDYLDLYLIHWPMAYEFTGYDIEDSIPLDQNGNPRRAQVTLMETWRAMEELVVKGLVKSIGVSNFPVMSLWDLLAGCKIPPVVNQVEVNPRYSSNDLIKFCSMANIHVTAYAPFGSSFAPLLELPEIQAIAAKHQGKSEANVVCAWLLQRGLSVLCKSWRAERIKANLDGVVGLNLDQSDMDSMDSLNTNTRCLDFSEDWGVNVWA